MPKKHKTMSIPLEYAQEMEHLFNELKDVCDVLQISSWSELVRVLAKIGKEPFLEIVEQVRKARKESQPPQRER